MFNALCISGIKQTWLRCIIFWMYVCILFASIILSILKSMFRDTDLSFCFLVVSSSGFGIGAMLTESAPSVSFFFSLFLL